MRRELDQPKTTYRIGMIEGVLMIAVAVIYDLAQGALTLLWGIGLALGWIITLWADLTFWFWFTLRGVSFWNGKRFGIAGIANVIEWTPLNFLPTCTAGVLLLWLNTRAEDVLAQVSPTTARVINKATKFKK